MHSHFVQSPLVRLALALLATGSSAGSWGCGEEAEGTEEVIPEVRVGSVSGGPESGDAPASDECLRFCQKSLTCAAAEGLTVPEPARDCRRSCGPNGVHRTAPPSLLACATETCGPAFSDCARRAVIANMRGRDIAVFPPICEGLCAKSAWCHERTETPLGPGEDDCEAACAPGGPFASAPPAEHVCVHAECGLPFDQCRTRHGEGTAPPTTAPTRTPAPASP